MDVRSFVDGLYECRNCGEAFRLPPLLQDCPKCGERAVYMTPVKVYMVPVPNGSQYLYDHEGNFVTSVVDANKRDAVEALVLLKDTFRGFVVLVRNAQEIDILRAINMSHREAYRVAIKRKYIVPKKSVLKPAPNLLDDYKTPEEIDMEELVCTVDNVPYNIREELLTNVKNRRTKSSA